MTFIVVKTTLEFACCNRGAILSAMISASPEL